jgi:hypothetical protein
MSTGPDKGLGGVDGAATAGLVMAIIDQNVSDTDAAILTARFTQKAIPCSCGRACCAGFRPYLPWIEAIALLVEALPNPFPETRANYTLRQACIRKFFGEKVSLVAAAKEARVHRDTASQHNSRIVRMLREDERRAIYEVGAALTSSGLLVL